MIIKILGSGCAKCQQLEQNAKKAVEELGLSDAKIEHIYDIDKIVEMGITLTPAIMIDDEIKAEGRIPEVEEIKGWLQNKK
ncbi:TM0996/MTH895 family glutaredoxin-like protein [Candidatus Parcubacteria bacterium]|nr:TM0996/MTH895 family glutaredoxin-like protein [Candidatus Parcubacteria bacterium]